MAAAVSGHKVPSLATLLTVKEGIPAPSMGQCLIPIFQDDERKKYPISEEAWTLLKSLRLMQGYMGLASMGSTAAIVGSVLFKVKKAVSLQLQIFNQVPVPALCRVKDEWGYSKRYCDKDVAETWHKALNNLKKWEKLDHYATGITLVSAPVIAYLSYKIFTALHQYFRKSQFEEVQKRLTVEIKEAASQLGPKDVQQYDVIFKNAEALRANLQVIQFDADAAFSPLDKLVGTFSEERILNVLKNISSMNIQSAHFQTLKDWVSKPTMTMAALHQLAKASHELYKETKNKFFKHLAVHLFSLREVDGQFIRDRKGFQENLDNYRG